MSRSFSCLNLVLAFFFKGLNFLIVRISPIFYEHSSFQKSKPKISRSNKLQDGTLVLKALYNLHFTILLSDKGKTTVYLHISAHVNEIHSFLEDPASKIERKLSSVLKYANSKKRVSKQLLSKNSRPPHLFDLPKGHKQSIPKNTSLYPLHFLSVSFCLKQT